MSKYFKEYEENEIKIVKDIIKNEITNNTNYFVREVENMREK